MPEWGMRFADPSHCPSCAAPITGRSICTACGFDTTSQPARELWQTLLRADALLEQARAEVAAVPRSYADETSAAALPQAPSMPDRPARRSLSTGSILLGLGALFILVAGVIFITVSWGSLGVMGRALVLLAFTAVVGAIASRVTRRALRASAEALWTVFLGLVTLDWFAAWDQGLFGLDALSPVAAAVVWSGVMFAVGSYVVRWARPRFDTSGEHLVAPMIVAGLAPWVGGVAIAVELFDDAEWSPFWSGAAATFFVVAFLMVARRLGHKLTWILLAAGVSVGVLSVTITALVEAFENPSAQGLFANRHGLPLLVVMIAAITVGLLVRRAAAVTSAFAVLASSTLVALPVESAHEGRGAMLVLSGLVVGGALVLRQVDPWSKGARAATALIAIGLTLAALPWLDTVASMLEESFHRADGEADFWSRPVTIDQGPGPWWLAAVVFGALALAVILTRSWPEVGTVRQWLAPVAMLIALAGVVVTLAAGEAPFAVAALVTIAFGAALSQSPPRDHLAWSFAGPVVVALAPLLPLSSRAASLVVWLVAALVLAAIAVRSSAGWRREAGLFGSAGWGFGAVGIAMSLTNQPDRYVALSLVIASAVGLAVASFPLRPVVGRRGVEVGAAVVAVTGIGIASVGDVTLGWVAAIWTVLGAAISLLSLFTPDRRHFRWIGFGALGIAYVLRLVASDIETVEAYTLPFGVVLIGAGLWWMRGRPEVTTVRALGTGLLLALLPSVPLALDEPTGLRALLLGLGSFVALVVGVSQRWKAPFVLGVVILLLLVLANLGPLALGLPRWVLIATAGVLLLGAGVTWEHRVRNGRAVATYVGSLR